MRPLSKIRRVLALLACAFAVVGCAACVTAFFHQDRPTGEAGQEAEALTDRMLTALSFSSWSDTEAVRFRLRDGRPVLLWDKRRNLVEARHDDGLRVLLDLETRRAVAFRDDAPVADDELSRLAEDTYATWANDSFWLIAPFKARDPGTTRRVVERDGKRQLLVEYSSGGVTPGDAYLWELDDEGRPVAWRMWVKIIPVGGVRVAWSDWVTLPTGALVARERTWDVGAKAVTFNPLEAAASLSELVGDEDPFAPLVDGP